MGGVPPPEIYYNYCLESSLCKSVNISHSEPSHTCHWGIMWVTKEQQKCLHNLKSQSNGIKDKLVQGHWTAWRSVWGWILRAHWGPHGVKHKGPISCSQHKQNGHRSSSVALTYQFSHFTDFPTLRIIIWPRALSFKGINRSEYLLCLSQCSLSSLDEHVTLLYFPQYLPTKYLFSLLTCISVAAGALSLNHNMGPGELLGCDMQLIGITASSKQGFCIFPEENERLSDACQYASSCQLSNAWPELTDFHFHLFQPLMPKSGWNTLKCRMTLSKYKLMQNSKEFWQINTRRGG